MREPAETHEVLRELRAELDASYKNRMLLAEANQWPSDVIQYFGDGKRMPHGVSLPADAAVVHGDATGRSHPISEILYQTPGFPTPASGRSSCATTTS